MHENLVRGAPDNTRGKIATIYAFLSVVVALVVGGIEALALIASAFQLKGAFWGATQSLNGNFGKLGYFIVGFFALSWVLSILFYKWQRLDELEVCVDATSRLESGTGVS